MEYLDKIASLPPMVQRIVCDKATERPHTGRYNTFEKKGTYLCRRCGLALFRGKSQFSSGCGWPSFDGQILENVQQIPDKDGQRLEIICSRCQSHLGHVFRGEYFTANNLRHCVNSLSLDFVGNDEVEDSEEAIVAGGCFWGIDHFLRLIPGVLKVEVGYIGGHLLGPTYHQVCSGNSGHYEGARVVFDPLRTNYHAIIKRFFEIHDPTQHSGQGPDLGPQYKSAIFYYDNAQYQIAISLINKLKEKGYNVATKLLEVTPFWPAEDYHQNYYAKNHKSPYCHRPETRFAEE